jgi:hypothetical protein
MYLNTNKIIKCSSFRYPTSMNIGDEIQTIAAILVLKKMGIILDKFIDRDFVFSDTETSLLINGWFDSSRTQFPFPSNIKAIFSNFHIADYCNNKSLFLSEKSIQYLKEHQPIGCRDRITQEILNKKNIETYFGYCPTLLFEKRTAEESKKADTIFIVDLDKFLPLPPNLKKEKIEYIKHTLPMKFSHKLKMIIAQEYLDRYRKEAKLVITSRLHCALPCIAMGIPVIVMGDHKDKRLQLVEEFTKIHPYFTINMRGSYKNIDSRSKLTGVFIKEVFQFIYYRVRYYQYYKKMNWNVDSLNIENKKEEIFRLIYDKVSNLMGTTINKI